MTLRTNSEYIKWSFSIGYFERYVNSKSDYLELLLSVYDVYLTSSEAIGPDHRPLWLLIGTPSAIRPELASRRAEHSLPYSDFSIYIFDI